MVENRPIKLTTEIMKEPVKGWFKLLSQQEGEFYNVRIVDDVDEMNELTEKLEVIFILKKISFKISSNVYRSKD